MSKQRKLDLDPALGGLTHNPFAELARQRGQSVPEVDRMADSDGSSRAEIEDGCEAAVGRRTIELRRERKGRGGKVVTLIQWLGATPSQGEVEGLAKRLAKGLGAGARASEGSVTVQGDLADRVDALLRKEYGEAVEIVRATR